jgi:hypothetical protein
MKQDQDLVFGHRDIGLPKMGSGFVGLSGCGKRILRGQAASPAVGDIQDHIHCLLQQASRFSLQFHCSNRQSSLFNLKANV